MIRDLVLSTKVTFSNGIVPKFSKCKIPTNVQTGLALENSNRFCCLLIHLGTFPLFAQYINTVAIMLNEPIHEIMVRVV